MLAIGETVEEVNDSGFLGSTPTIRSQLMADDSMLQVLYLSCWPALTGVWHCTTLVGFGQRFLECSTEAEQAPGSG